MMMGPSFCALIVALIVAGCGGTSDTRGASTKASGGPEVASAVKSTTVAKANPAPAAKQTPASSGEKPPAKAAATKTSQDKAAVADADARVVFVTDKGDVSVTVEVQRTPKELQRGLMFRENLPKGTGMLFVMPRLRPQTFWMRNTLIPLDMIFVDEARRIVGIVANTTPLDETPRGVETPSRFVIEVPGGYCQEVGIATGDRVRFLDIDGL